MRHDLSSVRKAIAEQPVDSVLVGIVDGAPDLSSREFDGVDLSIEDLMMPDGEDEPDAHGTEICGLILGRHGLARGATGLALPIFFRARSGERRLSASQMDMARALTLAVERGVDIINVSAGQKASTPEAARHLTDAIALCERERVLIVAAAGNDGCPCIHIPAAMPSVLAVGAMRDDGAPLEPSNWGDSYAANGVLAPGHEIEVASIGGAIEQRSGTSFATAVVSGVAAALLSISRRRSYGLDAIDIGKLLIETAAPCDALLDADCSRVLAGRLDVETAMERLHQLGADRGGAAAASKIDSYPLENGGHVMSEVLERYVGQSAEAGKPVVLQQACSCNSKQDDHHHEKKATRQSAEDVFIQQGCGCQSKSEPQFVYAIGSLWFDFGTEARYDAIVQQLNDPIAANNPSKLFGFLRDNLHFASGITFVLMQDQIPIYAIHPSGPFALEIYRAMLDAADSSLETDGDLQRVAIAGVMSGTTRLMNGMTLPILYPDFRSMVKWRPSQLAEAAKSALGDDAFDGERLLDFLVRIYDELRNLGVSPPERAVNFAATNAYQAAAVLADAARRKLELYRISVKKSPICRPESDCWDVQLEMFDPENDRRAARFYRYTVDVSEILPVTLGVMRSWNAPLSSVR